MGRSERSTRCRAGWPRPRRRAPAGLQGPVDARRGLSRLVDWWRAGARPGVSARGDSRRQARARRARRRGARGADPLRLGDPGPRGRRVRARVRRRRRRAARLRGLQLHDRAAPGAAGVAASGPATRWSPSATRSSPPPTPSATAARRPVFVDVEPDTFNIDPARWSRRRSRTGPRRSSSCTSSACRATSRDPRAGARHGLPVIEDAACAIGSEVRWHGDWERDRPAARRRRLLLVPSAQAALHRRRRHADDAQRRRWIDVPAAAAARHERARHRAARASQVMFEEYPVPASTTG